MIAPKAIATTGGKGGGNAQTLAPAPAIYNNVPKMTLGMMGNGGAAPYDDCEFAGYGHAVQLWNAAAGRPNGVISDAEVEKAFFIGTPNFPEYWKTNGFAGHPLTDFRILNTAVLQNVLNTIYYFGCAPVSFNMPISAQTQKSFAVTTGPNSVPGSWGPHEMLMIPNWNLTTGMMSCITWGGIYNMPVPWFQKYQNGGLKLLSPEWINAATGVSPTKYTLAQLQTFMDFN